MVGSIDKQAKSCTTMRRLKATIYADLVETHTTNVMSVISAPVGSNLGNQIYEVVFVLFSKNW